MYAVVVGGVYPRQLVWVTDSFKNASAMSEHLNAVIAPETRVEEVEGYPTAEQIYMTQADTVWRNAAESYLAGHHINTSAA